VLGACVDVEAETAPPTLESQSLLAYQRFYEDDASEQMAALVDLVSVEVTDTPHGFYFQALTPEDVEMFDHYAEEQGKDGWIAEAAKMKRAPDGRVVPMIPEGARPYASVRVDLVNPQTSEVGQVGEQPMVAALAEFQALARAPALFPMGGLPFTLHISTQCPWDQLPISLRFEHRAGVTALDGLIGDWYHAGFEGAFGTRDAQRFHYVSDPDVKRDGYGVTYTFDLGRSRVEAIDDLLRRLVGFHAGHPIRALIIGRGYLL